MLVAAHAPYAGRIVDLPDPLPPAPTGTPAAGLLAGEMGASGDVTTATEAEFCLCSVLLRGLILRLFFGMTFWVAFYRACLCFVG